MRLGKRLGFILLLSIMLLASPARADGITVSDISRQLICQCGCTMVLLNCSHAECGSREAMTALIKEKISQGQSEEEIIQFFVAQYGERVLAAPPKKGFNLTAWLLPFVALLAGAGVIFVALRKWVRREPLPQTQPALGEEDEEYRKRLEEELKEFIERSFR